METTPVIMRSIVARSLIQTGIDAHVVAIPDPGDDGNPPADVLGANVADLLRETGRD